MKKILYAFTGGMFIMLCSHMAVAQFNTLQYVSHGYFTGLSFTDSLMIKADFVITISQKEVEILQVDIENPDKDIVYLKSRTMSALKYPTLDGQEYYVWKLGDRKMVLRVVDGTRYLSLYKTDEFGLPSEYITFKLKE